MVRRRPPTRMIVIGVLCGAALVVAVVVTSTWTSGSAAGGHRADHGTTDRALPTAAVDAGLAQVGPLFPQGLSHDHTCTASVVSSRSGDTILTAAHCLSGSVRGTVFAPGYSRGRTPYGVWTVTAAFVTTRWLLHQTPADDFAVLTVADRTIGGHSRTLASVTGSERVAPTPAPGTPIRVEAYNSGTKDAPQTCTTGMTLARGHPTFDCHGFVGGSSGSPWLLGASVRPVVVGVIGGRHQGGCSEHTSHSSRFGSSVVALVTRAGDGGTGDTPPSAGGDNCPTTSP